MQEKKAELQPRRMSVTSEAVFQKRLAFSTTSLNDMSTRSATRQTADYNGNLVSVKLDFGNTTITKDDLHELKQVSVS